MASCLGVEAGKQHQFPVQHAIGDAARGPAAAGDQQQQQQQGGTVEGTPAWSIGRTWRSYSDYYYRQYQERYGITPPGAGAGGEGGQPVMGAPANTVRSAASVQRHAGKTRVQESSSED